MRTPESAVSFGLLLDFYGELLSPRQREVAEYSYGDDLSLAEIAALTGITRQGVRDSLKKTESLLLHYEQTLGLVARFHRTDDALRAVLTEIAALYPTDASLSALVDRATALIENGEA